MSLHDFNFRRPPAKQERGTSDDDRALIEAAMAAGKLRRIAQGVSGLPPMVFDPKLNKIVIQEPQARAAAKRRTYHAGAESINAKRREERRQRQAEAVALQQAGKTREQIATLLGVHERTITDLLARARKEASEAGGGQ